MTTALHPTGGTATSPAADTATNVEYDGVIRAVFVTIHGHKHLITAEESQELAEQICRANDSRLTCHPVDFERAAGHIHHARLAVA